MSNSIESNSKQNSDRNFLVLIEGFICCFIDNAFLIDNALLTERKCIVKDQKFRKVKMQRDRRKYGKFDKKFV